MTNKDLSAYSKTIVICFIICLFKRGKKMQANCTLSLAEEFHIHYFLFTFLVVGKQFPAVKLFSRNCYLGKQKILSKYIGLLQMFLHRSILTTFYIFSKEIVQKFKRQRCLEQFAFHISVNSMKHFDKATPAVSLKKILQIFYMKADEKRNVLHVFYV